MTMPKRMGAEMRELIMVEDRTASCSSSATCGAAQASSTSSRSARSFRLVSKCLVMVEVA